MVPVKARLINSQVQKTNICVWRLSPEGPSRVTSRGFEPPTQPFQGCELPHTPRGRSPRKTCLSAGAEARNTLFEVVSPVQLRGS